jgi:hypothetical protein
MGDPACRAWRRRHIRRARERSGNQSRHSRPSRLADSIALHRPPQPCMHMLAPLGQSMGPTRLQCSSGIIGIVGIDFSDSYGVECVCATAGTSPGNVQGFFGSSATEVLRAERWRHTGHSDRLDRQSGDRLPGNRGAAFLGRCPGRQCRVPMRCEEASAGDARGGIGDQPE